MNLKLRTPFLYVTLKLFLAIVKFQGLTCNEDRNECQLASSPCTKRGVCHNSIGNFRCDCLPGWQGRHCERSDGSGLSTCLQGFTGQNCTEDFDECTEWNPCENGGTCLNTRGNFSCTCSTLWTGRICDEDVNECNLTTGLCHNGGSCVNIPGSYKCDCPYPFTGDVCDDISTSTTTSTTTKPSSTSSPNQNNTLYENTTDGHTSIPGQTTSHGTYGATSQRQPNREDEERIGGTNVWAIAGPFVGVLVVFWATGAGVFVYKKYLGKTNAIHIVGDQQHKKNESNISTTSKQMAERAE